MTPSRKRILWATSFVTALYALAVIPTATRADLLPPAPKASEVINGFVYRVMEDSTLYLGEGRFVRLWGLSINYKERFEQIVLHREIRCNVLGQEGKNIVADCFTIGADERSSPPQKAELDLFFWLPQLGIAGNFCNAYDIRTLAIDFAGAITYICAGIDGSFRSTGQ